MELEMVILPAPCPCQRAAPLIATLTAIVKAVRSRDGFALLAYVPSLPGRMLRNLGPRTASALAPAMAPIASASSAAARCTR
jgi:hypothetical protein